MLDEKWLTLRTEIGGLNWPKRHAAQFSGEWRKVFPTGAGVRYYEIEQAKT